MLKVISIITILIIIILVFLYIKSNQKSLDSYQNIGSYPTYKYADIKNKLKTGDIMLFSYKKHQSKIHEIFYYCRTKLLGSEYGHVGIVIRDNDKLFLLECTDSDHIGNNKSFHFNNYGKGGVRIIELETLLKEYENGYMGIFGVKFISTGSKQANFQEYKKTRQQNISKKMCASDYWQLLTFSFHTPLPMIWSCQTTI